MAWTSRVRVDTTDLDAFAASARRVADAIERGCHEAADELSAEGLRWAKADARRTAGAHGKHYPRAGTRWRLGLGEFFYGPDPAKRQGGMDFEYGSGNQARPHLNYTKSADVIEAKAERVALRHVDDALGRL